MLVYKYVAKDSNGAKLSGSIEADNQAVALDLLRKKNLTVISLKEQKAKQKARGFLMVTLDDLAIFSRQLATMIDSGVPLAQALDVLTQQTDKKAFAYIIGKMRSDIEEGVALSDSLNKYPQIFSPLFVSMVRAGEASGLLNEILDRLASYLEKTSSLQRKIRAALIYPIVVSAMALIITSVLLLKVIPTFKGIFEVLGGELPLATKMLILVSDIFSKYWYISFLIIGILIFALKKYINTEKGRQRFDTFMLKLPIFGELTRKVAVAKFSRTFATLVKSGVPILGALDIVSRTSGNKVIENAIISAKESIKGGETLAQPLADSKVFPTMVTRMISIGEQTGELEKMLTKIADFYDEQVDALVSGLASMIEPLIIAFLGIVIGAIVVALFMPIFKITELIAK